MLIETGDHTFYVIQHLDSKGRWVLSSLDHFIESVPLDKRGYQSSFSPSGKCWQETGMTGTYVMEDAVVLMTLLAVHHLETSFRVAKVHVIQTVSEICVATAKNPAPV